MYRGGCVLPVLAGFFCSTCRHSYQLVKVMTSAPTGGTICIGAEARLIVYPGRLHVGNVTNV